MKVIRLENRNGHYKFYELWAGAYVNNATGIADKAFVGTRYGKIGTEGHTELVEFQGEGCKANAYAFLQKKVREKQAKGYEMVSEEKKPDEAGVVAIEDSAENSAQLALG